jgi:hypothetical protein
LEEALEGGALDGVLVVRPASNHRRLGLLRHALKGVEVVLILVGWRDEPSLRGVGWEASKRTRIRHVVQIRRARRSVGNARAPTAARRRKRR